jgi:hypothetical protein
MGFLKAKGKYWRNTQSEYFERIAASLLQREQNNIINENAEEKNKKQAWKKKWKKIKR